MTVEASAQLQVSTAELGTVIATKQVNDLPLNGRNFTQLLSLTPGVAPISVSQNNMGGRTGGFAAPIAEGSEFQFPAINGATNRSNYFLTDGLTNFRGISSTYAVPPIIDAIQVDEVFGDDFKPIDLGPVFEDVGEVDAAEADPQAEVRQAESRDPWFPMAHHAGQFTPERFLGTPKYASAAARAAGRKSSWSRVQGRRGRAGGRHRYR